ncbi:MAG: SDR family NAD(P)-dependent oxidoreductase [Sphaerochaetaceae bacterium]
MILDKFKLDGKVSIVTGASKGIGRSLALGLAEAGSDIAVVARNVSELDILAAEIEALGRCCQVVPCDVGKVSEITLMVAKVHGYFGHIDILVNNAAINIRKATLEVDESEWDMQMGINIKGAYFCAQEVGKIMKDQHAGSIINLCSNVSVVALRDQVMYCTSKGALSQMTKALALDLCDYGIRVNALGPGLTGPTHLTEGIFSNPEKLQYRLNRIPMHRVARPEEMQGAVVYLASEASSYMTGHTIYVDGGWIING